MDFRLNEEQELIRQTAREFAEKEVAPRVSELEATHQFPRDLVGRMAELGFLGMTYPPEYGGGGVDTVSYLVATEELARVDVGVQNTVGLHNSLVGPAIIHFGSEEQKKKYLPELASGQMLGCFALTEPVAGSDAANQQTTAVADGDGYVINGNKCFITNGSVADLAVLFASTDRTAGARGISAFLIETAQPGFRVGRVEKKMGLHSGPTAEIFFEDFRAPRDALLGSAGQGLRIAFHTLDGGRVSVAAQSVGVAEAAFGAALQYARERVQFGKPIASFQAIQWKLADMRTEIDAARLLTWHAGWLKDQGKPYSREAAEAKVYASETANRVTHSAIQIFGGYGCTEAYPVAKLFRDARITAIYEGTSEIQRLVIAQDLVKRWTP